MRATVEVNKIEQEQLRDDIPEFRPGDTLDISIKVTEGERTRIQHFEGVVIGIRHRGLNSSVTLRKVSHGVGVERSFQLHSPIIEKVIVKRRGLVRQAKLYYMRGLTGRKARIRERL